MAGRITALRFQKRTSERVNVYLDDEFALALPALDAAGLQVGQYLDDAEIERLRSVDVAQKAYDRALHFLSYRPRSTAEVRRHLLEASFDGQTVEAALSRLAQHGYVNDAEFARFWVENRQRFRPKGAQALRQELRQQGVDSEIIRAALEGLDSAEDAYQAARVRSVRLGSLAQSDPVSFRRKMGDFLMRRGFSYEVVKETIDRLLREILTGTASESVAEDDLSDRNGPC